MRQTMHAKEIAMSNIDDAEGHRLAKAAGLTRLDEKQMADFITGARATKALTDRLPKDLHWSEECAHVFSLERRRRTQK